MFSNQVIDIFEAKILVVYFKMNDNNNNKNFSMIPVFMLFFL